MRVRAFERNLIDRRPGELRESLLVVPPFAAQRLLPLDVGFDSVAVADMDGSGAAKPLGCALEGGDTPIPNLVKVDIECGLVELNDVDARRLDRPCLVVQNFGVREGKVSATLVVRVEPRVDHR